MPNTLFQRTEQKTLTISVFTFAKGKKSKGPEVVPDDIVRHPPSPFVVPGDTIFHPSWDEHRYPGRTSKWRQFAIFLYFHENELNLDMTRKLRELPIFVGFSPRERASGDECVIVHRMG